MEIKTFDDLFRYMKKGDFTSQEETDIFWFKKKWVAVDEIAERLRKASMVEIATILEELTA